jgi:hypothetical protein
MRGAVVVDRSRIQEFFLAIGRRFRRRRMDRFCRGLEIRSETLVLDVGGAPEIWDVSPVRPRLLIVNMSPVARIPGVSYVWADARNLPFAANAFPVVFSNSVMEHVGSYADQMRYASEIRRVGRRYFVQTGNQRFPFENHFLTPFIHWMPKSWQRRLVRNFTLWGWLVRPSTDDVNALIDELRLPTEDEMRACFPEATMEYERVLGMKKSLIAVKRG